MEHIENTEQFIQLLIDGVEKDPVSLEGWHCLHLDILGVEENDIHYVIEPHVRDVLDAYLDDNDSKSIFYGAKDLFILCHHVPLPTLQEIGSHLSDLFMAEFGIHPGMEIYDLCWQGWSFCEMLNQKTGDYRHHTYTASRHKEKARFEDPYGLNDTANSKRPLVIIVEDDPLTAQLAFNALKDQCDVRVKISLREAMEECDTSHPDAVFLDIGLPDGDGRQMLEHLIDNHSTRNVIMFSGNNKMETILEALQMGANGFITKPFRKEKLLHYVKNIA